MKTIEKALNLSRREDLHVFYSPHRAPRSLFERCKAYRFVRVERGRRYNREVIKAAVWISGKNNAKKIIAELMLAIYFGYGGNAAISDNHPFCSDAVLADWVRKMMREGEKLGCYMDCEEPFVEKEVLPLLKRAS